MQRARSAAGRGGDRACPSGPGGRPSATLRHRPGLDGIRGLAILLVVAFHAGAPIAGWAGVTAFFVLSGYLITSILLAEWRASRRLDLRRFYGRRALRLLPALVAVVVFVVACQLVRGQVDPIGPLAALLYVGNWAIVFGQNLGALGQTWSLAVEEQFYLVWPVLLLVLLRRAGVRAAGLACLGYAAAVGSLILLAPLGPTSVAYGSDTQGLSLAAGCAVALLDLRIERQWLAVASAGALLALTVVFSSFASFERVGLILATTASVALVVSGGLAFAPLAWLGRISYGLYLWHFALMHEWGLRSSLDWPIAACSILVAWASYRWIESPWLRLKDRVPALHLADPTRVPAGAKQPAARSRRASAVRADPGWQAAGPRRY